MAAPVLVGLHHLKLPVSHLDASIDWYARVLGAEHQPQFDHVDDNGTRYAVIMTVAGLPVPLELRWAPAAAEAMDGYDPISFAAGGTDELEAWAAHLDAVGVDRSPITAGAAGHLLVFADPDGTFLRLLEMPEGAIANIRMQEGNPEPDGPWVAPPSMRHPSTHEAAR
jgi:catechol 2,3-dioxygenase-like lactoylglutathione lyase family enzyme